MYTESGKKLSTEAFKSLTFSSGLAKVAVGVRLEGVNICGLQRNYRYTTFNRGEPEVPSFNQDFSL